MNPKHAAAFVPHGTYCCGYVAPRGVDPQSVAFATQHRDYHLARFPKTDAETRTNLDKLIASAKARAQGAA